MYNRGVHGIRSLTNGRQRHRVNTSKQITLESNRGIRSIHAISKTVRPQIAGIIGLLRAIDERTAHHRNTTCIATHMRVGTHQSHCHIKIQHHMQCSSRSNCEIYETVFRSRLHSNTIACQRIGISRPCGNTHAETYRIQPPQRAIPPCTQYDRSTENRNAAPHATRNQNLPDSQ